MMNKNEHVTAVCKVKRLNEYMFLNGNQVQTKLQLELTRKNKDLKNLL